MMCVSQIGNFIFLLCNNIKEVKKSKRQQSNDQSNEEKFEEIQNTDV